MLRRRCAAALRRPRAGRPVAGDDGVAGAGGAGGADARRHFARSELSGMPSERAVLYEEKRRNREASGQLPTSPSHARYQPAQVLDNFESRQALKEVRWLGKEGRWEDALAAFARVEEKGPWLRGAMMNAFHRSHRHDLVEQLWTECEERTSDLYSALIHIVGARQPHRADALLEEMAQRTVEPCAKLYGTLINAHGLAHNTARALDLFREMPEKGLVPNAVTYQVALTACARASDTATAESLLEQMRAAGFPIELRHFNIMVTACARDKDEAKARGYIQKARDLGLRPDVVAYTALMGSFAGPEALDKADALLRQMQEEGVALDSFVFNALLRIAVEQRAPERFNQFLADMEALGLPHNHETKLRFRELQDMQAHAPREQEPFAQDHRQHAAPQPSMAAAEAAPLPQGWQSALDPGSGQPYYWQTADPAGTTTWQRPA